MDPYISPLFGNFRGFPPMLIQVGSIEMLLSDSVEAAAKARIQGVKVRLSVYEGMFHVFRWDISISRSPSVHGRRSSVSKGD